MSIKPTTGNKAFMALALPFAEAGGFCLYWNVFKVYEAVHLGTVGYLTALGVDVTASVIVAALAAAFWSTSHFIKAYSLYED